MITETNVKNFIKGKKIKLLKFGCLFNLFFHVSGRYQGSGPKWLIMLKRRKRNRNRRVHVSVGDLVNFYLTFIQP